MTKKEFDEAYNSVCAWIKAEYKKHPKDLVFIKASIQGREIDPLIAENSGQSANLIAKFAPAETGILLFGDTGCVFIPYYTISDVSGKIYERSEHE